MTEKTQMEKELETRILTARFLNDVAEELIRAREKFPSNEIMYMALAEEFGELGNALIEHHYLVEKALLANKGLVRSSVRHVWDEAVQTACMALRVAVDGDGSIPAYQPSYEIISGGDEDA